MCLYCIKVMSRRQGIKAWVSVIHKKNITETLHLRHTTEDTISIQIEFIHNKTVGTFILSEQRVMNITLDLRPRKSNYLKIIIL